MYTISQKKQKQDPLAQDNNNLSANIHNIIRSPLQSNIFSPVSIFTITNLLHLGTDNKSFQELAQLFSLNSMDHTLEINKSLVKLHDKLNNLTSNNFNMVMCNNFYLSSKFTIKPAYKKILGEIGDIESMDFNEPKKCVAKINKYVNKQTKGMIPTILEKLDSDTKLVLVNCIYLNPKWKYPFKIDNTKKISFTPLQNKKHSIDFMHHKTISIPYTESDEYQVVSIPYVQEDLVFDVVLPNKSTSESLNINTSKLFDLLNKCYTRKIELYLPKFEHDTTLNLIEIFKMMGVNQIFEDSADFSLMTPNNEVKIGEFIHKAKVIVDEFGTEAAAATVAVAKLKGAMKKPIPPPVFKPDHTFRYFIRYVPDNVILFSGQFDGH